MRSVKLSPYTADDLNGVVDLFGRSVRSIARRDYDEAQIGAWAPEQPDRDAWTRSLGSGTVLVAEVAGRLAGFAKLDESGSVDLLFVDPEYERQGVASSLMSALLAKACALGAVRLSAEASVTARPFFESQGFRVVRDQSVNRRGVEIRNHYMERALP